MTSRDDRQSDESVPRVRSRRDRMGGTASGEPSRDRPAPADEYPRALASLVRNKVAEWRGLRGRIAPATADGSLRRAPGSSTGNRSTYETGGTAASSRGGGARAGRTVFMLRESSPATKALRACLIWVVIGLFMATTDALSPMTYIQVSAWLSLFFLGVVLSFWALLSLGRAAAATGALIGTFLGPYSLTWQLWVTYAKHWTAFFPVPLYPFPIVLDATEWYAMMIVGFVLFGSSLAALLRLSRPRPAFVRVQHDSGEAFRLGDPP